MAVDFAVEEVAQADECATEGDDDDQAVENPPDVHLIVAPVEPHGREDTHGGTVAGLFKPMKMREIMSKKVNWDVQWNLVIKKTIPLFWFPMHTITFILPANLQVLFAALLGVALGLILALAGGKKN